MSKSARSLPAIHFGALPRPDHVCSGFSGFTYFGATRILERGGWPRSGARPRSARQIPYVCIFCLIPLTTASNSAALADSICLSSASLRTMSSRYKDISLPLEQLTLEYRLIRIEQTHIPLAVQRIDQTFVDTAD